MPWFAVIDDVTGELVSTGTVLADPMPAGLVVIKLGEDHPTGEWDTAARKFVAVKRVASWEITSRAFLARFTKDERVAFELAAIDAPTAADAARKTAAGVRDYLRRVSSEPSVNLKRQQTRDDVVGFERDGILLSGRAAQILDTEPTPEEIIRG